MGKLLGGGPVCDSECHNIQCCTSTQRVVDPRWPHPERPRQFSEGSDTSVATFWRRRKQRHMTTIYCDSRKRVAGDDASFEMDIGETIHLQTGAKLSVLKFRVADSFLSFLYWVDSALGSLNWATLPVGAYTGTRLAAWISSNYAAATYVAETNEVQIAYDGNRRVLNDSELRDQFPGTGSYPPGASASKPLSINHLLGPSFIDGALQIHNFVVMNPYSELYLRCSTLANAAEIKGPLGSDIICKLIVDKGVGFIMQTRTDEGPLCQITRPHNLAVLAFQAHRRGRQRSKLNTRGTSVSFALFLDTEA